MRFPIRLGVALFLFAVCAGGVLAAIDTIDAEQMRRHVSFLAADEMRGRDTGESEIAVAERYIATAFESYGLEPLPDREFIVPFELYRSGYDRSATGVWFGDLSCRLGQDCRPFPFSGTGRHEAPVVFAGYGIHAPDQEWDDYAGLDVRDKIVLVLRHGPGEGAPEKEIEGSHQQFTVKAETARERGALAMLLVTDPLNHDNGDDLRLRSRLRLDPGDVDVSSGDASDEILSVHVSNEFATALIERSGQSLEDLQRALDGGALPAELSIGSPVARVSVSTVGEPQTVAARNVVAVLPGSDPTLRDEWVVVGAHHDHVGAYPGSGDTVFNGADDNASGVSAVLELAQAFAARKPAPKRTMVFATFTAEERGLLGSRALVRDVLPVDKLVFMLNLDMIGRNSDEDLRVFGDGYVRDLRELVESANAADPLQLSFEGRNYAANSDHDAFYRQGVPFMFFFSGTHEDYHRVGDHASKLDYARMQRITSLAFSVLDRWGGLGVPLTFIHHVPWLGIAVEKRADGSEAFAEVTAVDRGSRADAAGLLEGDRLLRIAGREIQSPSRVGRQFEDVSTGEEFELAWVRNGKTRSAEIVRVAPGYLGLMPGDVDDATRARLELAQGEGLLIRRVVPGGPSEAAGLEDGDMVLRIDGRPVDADTLGLRLAQLGAGAQVPLVVLRDGERVEMKITLGERP